MTINVKDPRLWSVDQVKQWAETTFPFGQTLAQSLSDNDVDGSVLLTHITDSTLKADIGVKSLGQRVKIIEKLGELRKLNGSVPCWLILSLDSRSDVLHPMPSPFSTRNGVVTPHKAHTTTGGGQTDRFMPSKVFQTDLSMSPFTQENLSQRTLEFTLEPSSTGRLFLRNIAGTSQSILSHFKAERTQFPPTPVTPSTRRTATQVENPGIMIASVNAEPHSSVTLDYQLPTWTDNDVEPEIQTPLLSKRHLEDVQSSPFHSPKRRRLNHAYFGTKGLRAVDVMFPPRDQMTDDNDDIIINHPTHPTGERIYVQQLTRKLFLNPDIIEFPHNNTIRTVWKLHPARLVKKHEQHTALVFDTNPTSGECTIFQGVVDVLGLPEQSTRQRRENTDGVVRFHCDDTNENPFEAGGDWGFLNKWSHMKDDTLLPVFLESDEEDAAYDDATLREMEAEERRKKGEEEPITKALSIDTVRRIIMEELERYVDIWTEKQLPKLEKRAYRIYRKQHLQRTKNIAVQNYRQDLKMVESRIEKYKIEYESIQWRSIDELKRVCVNMQESVDHVQNMVWNINLLSGKCPPKPVRDVPSDKLDSKIVDEAVETDGDDADEEDDDEDQIEDDEIEEDDMDGFVVDDDEIGEVMQEDDLGEVTDGVVNGDDDMEDVVVSNSPVKLRRSRRHIVVPEETDMDNDNDDGIHLDDDDDDDDDIPPKPATDPQNSAAALTNQTDASDIISTKLSQSGSPLREATALPTPPQEAEDVALPTLLKREYPAPAIESDCAADLSGYDSDIFMSFGGEEINEFCVCSNASATVAKDYLLKADGNTEKAIRMYFDDVDSGRFTLAAQSSASSAKAIKRKGKGKRVVLHDNNDEIEDDQPALAAIPQPSFKDVLPQGEELCFLTDLVSRLKPGDLHATLNDIANVAMHQKLDPSKSFIPGESIENCAAYRTVYLAYTHDLCGSPCLGTPSSDMFDKIHSFECFRPFYDRLIMYLGIKASPPPQSRPEIQDDDVELSQVSVVPPSPTPLPEKNKGKKEKVRKKVKAVKPITKSTEQMVQEAELRRLAEREREQKKKGKYITTTKEGDVVVNLGKKGADQAVCLHPELAKEMKPHQIEGVQFIWRQVITIRSGKGCLLAHTMGLGKTLQIIAVLITLSLLPAGARVEMPDHLKKENRRYLVVCPPGIVENWKKEFKRWTPESCYDALGMIYCVNQISLAERMYTIKRWYDNGGVLIIGYSQFRALLLPKRGTEENLKKLRTWLLKPGADLIVADEAHEIKNEKSKIGHLLGQIEKGSRIATTGSPLSNHLKEYWAMMHWIHPGFLGSLRAFTSQYITPIKEGLYQDSEHSERKESQRRLVKLKALLKDKIQRRDLTVIQADLPQKTEFVICTPLTPLQRQLYEALINESGWNQANGRNLFKWINILRLICNHPFTLKQYISDRQRNNSNRQESKPIARSLEDATEDSEAPSRALSPDDEDAEEFPPVDELAWAKTVFEGLGDKLGELMFSEYSNKARIVLSIVSKSVKLKENILIFVHSIPTLHYLETKLKHKFPTTKFFVLIGTTPMKERQPMIDQFNRSEKAVFLISCKAGSLGLNITSANRVILYDLTWNPVHDQQAVGRAYRLGQKKHVFVYRLGTYGTYEETFFTENVFKLNLSKRVIDKQNPGRFGISKNVDLTKYFKTPKSDDDAVEIDKSLFENKDQILDHLIEKSDSGKGAKIMELDLTETFHKDEEETYLTAEDTLAANAEAEAEKQLREEGKYVEPTNNTYPQSRLATELFPESYQSPKGYCGVGVAGGKDAPPNLCYNRSKSLAETHEINDIKAKKGSFRLV